MDSSRKSSVLLSDDYGFSQIVLGWSLEDVFNENLFKVDKIPVSFESVYQYLIAYRYPLLEETRAQIHSSLEVISRAPYAEVNDFTEAKPHGSLLYDVKVDQWKNGSSSHGKEPYKTLPGDLVILANAKPETVSDLQRIGRTWTFALVKGISDDEDDDGSTSYQFKVQAPREVELSAESCFVVFLTNITTNRRIWNALHMWRYLEIINEVLSPDYNAVESWGLQCMKRNKIRDENILSLLSTLNESQSEGVLSCLRKVQFNDKPNVDLIWGPPGTGKTKTVSVLLYSLLRMKCRTLTCTPTNVAITEVASRVLKLVREAYETDSGATDTSIFSVGDILLFGNKERLNVNSDVKEIYLDYRVQRLIECFAPVTGWQSLFSSTIGFLEDCVSQYHIFLENELIKEKVHNPEIENSKRNIDRETKSFLDFVRERFLSSAMPLKECLLSLCTHVPESFIKKHNVADILLLVDLLDEFKSFLFWDCVISEALEEVFSCPELILDTSQDFGDMLMKLHWSRRKCISLLKSLQKSLNQIQLPSAMNKYSIIKFCFERASLIFCTASSSYKLHSMEIEPLKFLVIDEAAQLKECESTIPLQLCGIKHAILIGDECQLPAMVESNVSAEAGFGKSLFERLSSLGHPKHLLNMQYRMHPRISYFPNSNFYSNSISDAPNVMARSYTKQYLPGPMFGPYSFINVFGGREEMDEVGHSRLNAVEVAIVLKLLRVLHKAWSGKNESISVGVISPYAAQVTAIKEKLDRKFESGAAFSVKVRSVDGFQGGEEDIIIMSTVRANRGGAIGFMSNFQRINVALTRARHCLWILGNERTLTNSDSIWTNLVHDAKKRNCFFNVDQDKELAKTILEVKKEFDQLDDLLNGDSVYFRNSRWKVLFSENFRKSFGKLASVQLKATALNYILRLSGGWRPKTRLSDSNSDSTIILSQFKVVGSYIICSIDIVKEKMCFTQVLKVWDILPLEAIPRLSKRLNGIFGRYNDDFISRCNEKLFEGNLEIPITWPSTIDIIRYKSLGSNDTGNGLDSDDKCYVENSKVSDSLLLMKFYGLSSGVVGHLLSDANGQELDLPFEVTDEEMEIIFYQRSTFILGRSGTGKTTVLTTKLFKKEQLFHLAVEGCNGHNEATFKKVMQKNNSKYDDIGNIEEEKSVGLRQLFVTVSPKLCFAVKQQVSHLKSFASGGKYSSSNTQGDVEDFDDDAHFSDIPDSLSNVPPNLYPLVITFNKFLMMLDGTVGTSYFERFPDLRQLLCDKMGNSGSIVMQMFLKTREVNYDKFCSTYWPHFNSKLTKKLGPSRVFTEIMSQIKGGLRAEESSIGRLGRKDYVELADGRISTLNRQEREMIYEAFEEYEKMKMENGDFDAADFVIDLHRRLRNEGYAGDLMDFVYIDEVQDLTMRQVALFKHISKNVDEGFVFSGDTAQTIARGIDFRFEDIRSLFYNHFIMGSRIQGNDRLKEKGHISKIFQLNQNFRTHAGVLKLAQSVIDLLYRFFPMFVDILSHETSLIYGEAPILLESGNDDNAIITIFGNNESAGSTFVGFGAEQVVLVRDDAARKEISKYVGKRALVLTIVECKGLEFQDVLLYNFFGTSPLRNKWRVLYQYMSEQGLLDVSTQQSFPSFNTSKHNVLCSELKQLYVAITRTRQRLWICENSEFSEPMFDYWRKKGLVQVRKLDDSLATAMQVASSPQEWKSQGYKLLREGNYEMATMCFERAGDEYGEKYAKAAGLRAAADKMHSSNPETASTARRQAAEIFETIGKDEYAAECFFLLKEYERAGKIYLKCGESCMERAGECFYLAGCYEFAAEVYANGSHFSKCLKACSEGRLFEKGLQYIQCWKHDTDIKISTEIERTEQDFLVRCALHYHEKNDKGAMMKYVRAFDCVASIRDFLHKFGCIDELLSFEEESGNFLEAANIAKLKGELLLEADFLGKAGNSKDASLLILWYVFAYTLWPSRSKGWPPKKFQGMDGLLAKAKIFAEADSEEFRKFVHSEAEILSSDQSSLLTMKQQLDASRSYKSTRGEIVSARKILDAILKSNDAKFGWEDRIIPDLARFSELEISNNQVSADTLVYYWNFWKDLIVSKFEYLRSPELHVNDGEFCLNYLAVRRQFNNLNFIYNLLIPDAFWADGLDRKCIPKIGKFVSLDVHQFTSGAQSYWSSELLSVGINVLAKLESLYNLSVKRNFSLFSQSRLLCYIYKEAKFLLSANFLDRRFSDNKALQKFIELPSQRLVLCLCPLNWRESLKVNLISLRRTEDFGNLVKEVTSETVSKRVSYGQLGKIIVAILGSNKLDDQTFEKIKDGFGWMPSFVDLIADLCRVTADSNTQVAQMWNLQRALEDIYNVNWRKLNDYISPECFLYLLERQVFLVSCARGHFCTTKSCFTEMLVYLEQNNSSISRLQDSVARPFDAIVGFLGQTVAQCLIGKADTMNWIKKCHTNTKDCFAALTFRLAVLACLLYINYGFFRGHLSELLGKDWIKDELPRELVEALNKRRKQQNSKNFNADMIILSEAFKEIGNPLVVVSLEEKGPVFPDAIYVNVISQSKADIWEVLFPSTKEVELGNKSVSLDLRDVQKSSYFDDCGIKEMFTILRSLNEDSEKFVQTVPLIKVEVGQTISFFSTTLGRCCDSIKSEEAFREASMLIDEMKKLYVALDVSESELVNNMPRIGQILNAIELKMAKALSFFKFSYLEAAPCHEEEEKEETSEMTRGNSSESDAGNSCEAENKGKSKTTKKKRKGKAKKRKG